MVRILLKILYFVFAGIIGVIFGIVTYRSNAYSAIYAKTQDYIKNKQYNELVRTYCGYFDSTPIYTYEGENFNLVVYNGTQEVSAGSSTSIPYYHHSYDKAYYFIMTNVKFATNDVNSSNLTGIRLYDNSVNPAKTYDFKLRISTTINEKDYMDKDKMTKPEDYTLHNEREYINFGKNWGFYRVVLTETDIRAIKSATNMNIDSYNIINNEGVTQLANNVAFNFGFTEQFFTDIQDLCTLYNAFMPVSDGYNSNPKTKTKEEYDAAYTTYEARMNEWKTKAQSKQAPYDKYLIAYTEGEVLGSSAVWPTIGVMSIFVVVIILLYLLLFEMKRIKGLIERIRGNRGQKQRYVPNKLPENYKKKQPEYKPKNKEEPKDSETEESE